MPGYHVRAAKVKSRSLKKRRLGLRLGSYRKIAMVGEIWLRD